MKEKVSDFVTYFPYAEYRNINQGRAAELIDGTLVRPGETFSFNGTVGERTEENGFTTGFIISNGVFAEELGGGVSQVVTTTYNAAFFAGMDDVTHTPHSFYIDRYPLGREATVAWPSGRPEVPQLHAVRRDDPCVGRSVDGLVAGRDARPDVLDEVLGHHRRGVRPLQLQFTGHALRPDRRVRGQHRLRRLRRGRLPVLPAAGSSELVKKETNHVAYTPSDTVDLLRAPRSLRISASAGEATVATR